MSITIPFTQTDHQFVERHQPSKEIKARYFAAQATHRYLQRIGIPSTVLEREVDAGSLDIPEVGRLRSCPLSLHPEVREKQIEGLQPLEDLIDAIWDYEPSEDEAESYIGEVWIDLDENCKIGEVLGFTPLKQPDPVSPGREPATVAASVPVPDSVSVTVLKQWLEGIYEQSSSWERPSQLVDISFGSGGVTTENVAGQPTAPIYSQGKFVCRAKKLRLGQSNKRSVVLLVRITSKIVEEQEEFDVCIQLHVYKNSELINLPKKLKFTVLDHRGDVLRHAQASLEERYLEYQLNNCKSSYQFSVKVTLGEDSVIEKFVI